MTINRFQFVPLYLLARSTHFSERKQVNHNRKCNTILKISKGDTLSKKDEVSPFCYRSVDLCPGARFQKRVWFLESFAFNILKFKQSFLTEIL